MNDDFATYWNEVLEPMIPRSFPIEDMKRFVNLAWEHGFDSGWDASEESKHGNS